MSVAAAAALSAVGVATEEEAELAVVPPGVAVDLLVVDVVLFILDDPSGSVFHSVNFHQVPSFINHDPRQAAP